MKENNLLKVQNEIEQMVKEIHPVPLKVILETCLLTEEEKKQACRASIEGGAHFVKTSTGFSTGGACIEDIQLMLQCIKDMGSVKGTEGTKDSKGRVKIKASGGIRSYEQCKKFIEAGADRIGTSNGVQILETFLSLKKS